MAKVLMRYYLDTEFIEKPGVLQLISLGVACEDGRTFYAVTSEYDINQASDWVFEHVLPKLGKGPRETRAAIRGRLLEFIGDTSPEFWGYFADYDWVVFCWLFGAMIDLPKGWPMFCRDLKQEMARLGITKDDLPPQPSDAHNALADAQWIRHAHESVVRRIRDRALTRDWLARVDRKREAVMGAHLIDGQFQSDKYPSCPPGKVPLSVKDTMAQDLLWAYAQRRRAVDAEFSDDLEQALRDAGFRPKDEPHQTDEPEPAIVIPSGLTRENAAAFATKFNALLSAAAKADTSRQPKPPPPPEKSANSVAVSEATARWAAFTPEQQRYVISVLNDRTTNFVPIRALYDAAADVLREAGGERSTEPPEP